jgi:glycosyltransferase involved in cell wall biosynthesis
MTDKKKRIRILYIQRPGIGGSVTGLYDLVSGLDFKKFEPIVLFLKSSIYCEQFKKLGVRVITAGNPHSRFDSHSLGSKRDIAAELKQYSMSLADGYKTLKQFYLLTLRDLPIANRVYRLIKNLNIDLVHHNDNLPADRATVLGTCFTEVPQVCHIRTLKSLSFIEKYMSRFVNAFIYMSRVIEELYLDHGIPDSKGTVIYDGFDTKCYDKFEGYQFNVIKSELGIKDKDFVICNVGRIAGWKGQNFAIKALAKIVKFEPNAKLLIVGPTDPSPDNQVYYKKLLKLANEFNISDNVIFTGFRIDIPHLMAASDIIVHSSSEPEPFGRVIVEGMLAGKPVIATAAGGVLDIIEDQVTGFLVPIKDDLSMANAIIYLLKNPKKAEQISSNAQIIAKKRFNVKQHVEAVQTIYEDILEN